MKISMACRKIDLTQGMKDYAEKKLQKLDKFFDESTDAKLVFSVEKDRQKVELTIFHHNTIFRVETVTEDIYASVDKAISDVERQIRKNKTRLEKRLRSGALDSYNMPVEAVEEEKDFTIVKKKVFSAKPMSTEEAILQMNLLGHEFFVYVDAQNEHPSIVYKRKDGNYGLIELE